MEVLLSPKFASFGRSRPVALLKYEIGAVTPPRISCCLSFSDGQSVRSQPLHRARTQVEQWPLQGVSELVLLIPVGVVERRKKLDLLVDLGVAVAREAPQPCSESRHGGQRHEGLELGVTAKYLLILLR